jgi:hypothetical protein
MPIKAMVRPQPVDRRMQLTIAVGAKVPHDLAYQCLMSMPFDSGRAMTFLTQVRRILEFQSTVDILKSMDSACRLPVFIHATNIDH